MKLRFLLTSLVVGAALSAPGVASAATVTDTFTTTYTSGTYNGDTLTGTITLDVGAGGVANSGTLTISGAGLPDTETLGLIPVGQVYEAGGGAELLNNDNIFPVTSKGLFFGTNAPGSLNGGYTLGFGEWCGGD